MQASDSKKQEAPIVQQPKEISLLPHDNVHHHIHPQQTRQQLQLKEELEHQLQQLQEQKPPPVPPHQIPLKQQQVQFQQDKHQHQSDVRAEDLHHQHQQQKQHTIPGMGPPDNRKVLKKKMSTGNLRSPTVKRSAQAPVTMQGWLWKQGSDGFMRWKRRWFVLSDFCLFYYKGPEEDKLLGSILLPSYAISPCPNDNKVMKKFAFKLALKATTTTTATSDIEMAEHQNMRTYYFAADTKESLQQWLNAMSMATILQKDANSCQIYDDHLDSSHCSDSHNASTANEDEDSGFTSYHSRRYIGSPPDGSSPMNGSYTSDSLHLPDERYHDAPNDPSRMPHERSMNMYLGNNEKYPVPPYAHPHYYKNPKARQHLYANAPPKPRRLGPDQYGTVGEPPRAEQMMYNNGISHRHPDNFQDNQHDYPPPEYSATNKNVGSPANKEPVPSNRGRREVNYPHVQQGVWNPQVEYSGGQKEPNEYPPETARDPSGDFNNVENSNGMPRQPVVQGQDPGFQDEYDPAVLRQKGQRLYNAQRPHSANFLEYDAYEKQPENQYDQDPAVVRRVGKENLMRPKSSIERYGTPPNYWNEMTHQPLPPLHTPHTNPQAWGIMEQSPMSERNGWYQENPEQYNQPPHDYYSDAKYVTSVEMISPRVARETRVAAQRDPQFMRSASARLPSGGSRSVQGVDDLSPYSQDDLTDNDPKRVQQREESMKRLLEWKQRMLQSPFTKKHPQKLLQQEIQSQSPSSSEEYRKPSMIKKDPSGQEVGLEHRTASLRQSQEKALKHHEANSKAEDKKQSDEKNARLPVNPSNERIVYQPPLSIHASIKNSGDGKPSIAMMNQYRSSYSSDDEESGSGSFKGIYLSRTQPRRRNKSDLILEEPNLSDPELHLRNTQSLKLPKHGKQTDSSEGSSPRFSMSAGDLLGKTHEELILLLIQLRRTQSRLQKAIDTCRMELEGEKKLVQIDVKNRESHSRKVEELTIQLEEYMKQDKLQHLYMLDKSLQEESVVLTNLQQDKEMLERALSGIHMKAESTRNNVTEQERLLKQQHLVESELTKVQLQLSNTTKKLEETAFENTKIEREILLLRQKIQNTIRRTVPNPTVYMEDSETVQLKMQLEEELAHVQNIMEELSKRRNKINGAVQQLKEDGQKKVHEVRPSPTGVAGRGSAPLPGRKHSRSTYLETDLDTLETRDALDVGIIDETKQPPVAKPRRSQIPLYVNSNSLENQTNCPTGNKLLTYLPDRKEVEEFMEEQDTFCQDINEADEKMKRFYGILPRDKPSEVKTVRIVKRESERRNKTKDRGRKVLYDEQQSLTRVLEEPDSIMFEDFDYLEADVHATDFQRSMSLPRNYGRASYIPLHPPNSLALTTSASSSVSSTPTSTSSKVLPNVPYYYRTPSLSPTERFPSAHEQLFGFSPLPGVTSNLESPTNSPLATPVFQSEAARQIVAETAQQFMSSGGHEGDDEDVQDDEDVFRKLQWSGSKDAAGSLKRRHKRRHYTISSSQPLVLESHTPKMVHARSRDDLDMERCLRSANTPDVVKSTIKKTDTNFDESTIDRELGLPQKIVIPERYVEQEEEELTAEEKLHRLQKAESIKKMLSETTTYGDLTEDEIANASETLKKKFEQEKKQREQLLSLNQLLAQEVKERSKAVAAKAMQNPPELDNIKEEEDEDLSPVQPLPTIQQRENYLT